MEAGKASLGRTFMTINVETPVARGSICSRYGLRANGPCREARRLRHATWYRNRGRNRKTMGIFRKWGAVHSRTGMRISLRLGRSPGSIRVVLSITSALLCGPPIGSTIKQGLH
jgi:hypothetical protein